MTEADLAKFQSCTRWIIWCFEQINGSGRTISQSKADQQFIDFQREYTAIENSIRAETVNYNAAVKEYNTSIKVFRITSSQISNFKEKPLFKADAGAEKAPEVSLNNE